jgi:hypothetical protein
MWGKTSAPTADPPSTVGGNLSYYNSYGKQYECSSKTKHRTAI